MKTLAVWIGAVMIAGLAPPAFGRVEDYGPRRYTQVGRQEEHHGARGERGRERGYERGPVIDRRRGPGWGGAAAAGILGFAAGLALGGESAPPVVVGPPPIGTVVPAIPAGCVSMPAYRGGVVFDCGGIYYQPFYDGMSLMYEVVPAP
jgi:hypothetical protein